MKLNTFLVRIGVIKLDAIKFLITNFAEKVHLCRQLSATFSNLVVKLMSTKSHLQLLYTIDEGIGFGLEHRSENLSFVDQRSFDPPSPLFVRRKKFKCCIYEAFNALAPPPPCLVDSTNIDCGHQD